MSIESIITLVSVGAASSAVASSLVPLVSAYFKSRKKTEEDQLNEIHQELEQLLEHQKEIEKENHRYVSEINELYKRQKEILEQLKVGRKTKHTRQKT